MDEISIQKPADGTRYSGGKGREEGRNPEALEVCGKGLWGCSRAKLMDNGHGT